MASEKIKGLPVKCITCGSTVYPKKGFYECCGIRESISKVSEANEDYRRPRRSIEDILFKMNYGVYPEQLREPYEECCFDEDEEQ